MTAGRNQQVGRTTLLTFAAIVCCAQVSGGQVPVGYRAVAPDMQAGTAVAETAFNYSVSNDGAADVTIPLTLPPGRLGMQPHLALSYSSRGGNGPVGVGWSISGVSSISYCRKSVATDGTIGDERPRGFCLDGQRLIPIAPMGADEFNATEFRTEIDSYRKITVDRGPEPLRPLSFTVYEPDGLIRYYGLRDAATPPSNSRFLGKLLVSCSFTWSCAESPPGFEEARIWLMDTVKDRFNNEIQYDYSSGSGLLLKQVRYTSNGSTPGTKKIDFEYEARSDARTVRIGGIKNTIDQRLRKIEVSGPLGLADSAAYGASGDNGILTRYWLSYGVNATTKQSQLETVQECPLVGPTEFCKPPLTFSYSGTTHTYEDRLVLSTASGGSTFPQLGIVPADLNGDGRDDLLYRDGAGAWHHRLNTGASSGALLGAEQNPGITGDLGDSFAMMLGAVDLNGDRAVDVVAPDTGGFRILFGKTTGTLDPPAFFGSVFATGSAGLGIAAIADIDGDSRPDLIADRSCTQLTGTQDKWCTRSYALNTSTNGVASFGSAAPLKQPESSVCPAYNSTVCNLLKCSGFECRPAHCINGMIDQGETGIALDGQSQCGGDCIPCGEAGPYVRKGAPAYVADFDGNGAADIFTPLWNTTTTGYGNTLGAVSKSTPVGSFPVMHSTGHLANVPARFFLDVNGDGLSDTVDLENGSLMLSFSAGKEYEPPFATASGLTLPSTWANEARVGDFNDDGLQDLYLVSSNTFLRSTGTELVVDSLPITVGVNSGTTDATRRKFDHWIDFNGDGLKDMLQMKSDGLHVMQRVGPAPAKLTRVTGGPLTAQVKFEYRPSIEIHTAATTSCSFPQYCLRNGMWLVARVSTETDTTEPDPFNHVSFTYSGGRFDVRGRGWLGFEERKMTNELTATVVTTKFDNTQTLQRTVPGPAYLYPLAGRPVEVVVEFDDRPAADSSGTKRRITTKYHYEPPTFGTGDTAAVATVKLTEVRTQQDEAQVTIVSWNPPTPSYTYSPVRSRLDSYILSPFGLVTHQESHVFPGGFTTAGAIPSGVAVWSSVTDRLATPDATNWLVRRFMRVFHTSTEPARPNRPQQTVQREIAVTWEPGTQAVASVTVEPTANPQMPQMNPPYLRSTTTFTRVAADKGNVSEVKYVGVTMADRITKVEWDSLDQTLPTKITNAELHEEKLYFHAGLGVLVAQDDANNLRTFTQVDAFGRPKRIDLPTGDSTTIAYARAGSLLKISETRTSGRSNSVLFNKAGNARRSEWTSFDGRVAAVERTFTRAGKLATQTVPFIGTATSIATVVGYDRRDRSGRTTSVTYPDEATQSWSYDRLITTFTNPRGVSSEIEVDAAGRTIRSATIENTSHRVTTTYEYGPFDVLQAVTDTMGNRIQQEHDKLGRTTSIIDPDIGTTYFSDNPAGESISVSSPPGPSVQLRTLDKLGRLTNSRTTRYQNGMPVGTPEIDTFTWDSASNGIGGLASAEAASGDDTTFGYSARGQLNHVEQKVAGTSYVIDVVHDGVGRPSTLELPAAPLHGRPVVRFDYNSAGYAYKMSRMAHPNPFGIVVPEMPLWSAREVDAAGMVRSEQYGGSGLQSSFGGKLPHIVTHRTPDPAGRVRRQYTLVDGTTIQDLVYEYGSDSLIKTRHDRVAQTTEDFDYDFLSRLKKWIVYQNCWKTEMQYDYDDIGNLTQRSTVGQTNPIINQYHQTANAGPHALTTSTQGATSATYAYEEGGRQVSAPGRSVVYKYFNLPESIVGSTIVNYKYDAFHARTQRVRSTGEVTHYAGTLFERSVAGATSRYTYHLGIGDLEINETQGSVGETYSFFHRDLLGTPDTVTGHDGTVRERMKFEPFGQRRYPTDLAYPISLSSERSTGFTGHEPDDDFGLINMRGRIYDQKTGRFLTPDPLVQSPLSSQSFNRYSYVFNNPINAVDPSGFETIGISGSYSGSTGSGSLGGYSSYSDIGVYWSSASSGSGSGSNPWVSVAQDMTGVGQTSGPVGPQAGAGAGVSTVPGGQRDWTTETLVDLLSVLAQYGLTAMPSAAEIAGIGVGVVQGITPGGFMASLVVERESFEPDFERGVGEGMMFVGTVQTIIGAGEIAGGVGAYLSALGGPFGGPEGVVVSVAAVAAAESAIAHGLIVGTHGAANLAAGLMVFSKTPRKSDYGTYKNQHESRNTYSGMGSKERSQRSGSEKAKKYSDPHTSTDWTPAESEPHQRFDEALRIIEGGGKNSKSNYNKIETGKKIDPELLKDFEEYILKR